MSAIGGVKKETSEYGKRVGIMEAKVIAINPTMEQYKDKLGMELKEESKAAEYIGESRDGNTTLRMDVWLADAKELTKRMKVSFFLEDKERQNKDETKKQYINNVGNCSWAEDPNDLPDWFKARDYRVAKVGEEEFYEFLRTWLGNLDYRSAATTLEIEWKKLMKNNTKDLQDQINGEWATNVGVLATVVIKEKEGAIQEYQGVYNRGFLPVYALKQFKMTDYNNPAVLDAIRSKPTRDQKVHEKFAVRVTSEHGCKDFFLLSDIKDYDPAENIVTSNEAFVGEEDEENEVGF
jgi:hypothetical protein